MKVFSEIRKNAYYDSVSLMQISKKVEQLEGVEKTLVGMGTKLNKDLASNMNISNDALQNTTANDMFIVFKAVDESVAEKAYQMIDELLNNKKQFASEDYRVPTLDSALRQSTDSNLVLISVPGKYAFEEAKKALEAEKHVMIFSDNVSVEQELELKKLAVEKGLLMMGPDCGTAIINHKPLGFANDVSAGTIGIVGASGTGTQEISVLIDRLGEGVSQVIGTGGRDLKAEIGGLMMLQGFKALIEDEATKIIVLISKKPDEKVVEEILELSCTTEKEVITNFIGCNKELIESYGVYYAETLEETALKAVMLTRKEYGEITEVDLFKELKPHNLEIEALITSELEGFSSHQKNLLGLFTGGTLAGETVLIMNRSLKSIHTNMSKGPKIDINTLTELDHDICLDLGEDEFTVGRAHPMIDPSLRTEIIKNGIGNNVAVLLLDVVLGYGSHPDPVGEMYDALVKAKTDAKSRGDYLSIICSICVTDKDPQD